MVLYNIELSKQSSSHNAYVLLMICSKCLCPNVYLQYEGICVNQRLIKLAFLTAWPWCGDSSEFRACGLGLADLNSLNLWWQKQLLPREPLTLEGLQYCVWLCGLGFVFANTSSCCPHTILPSPTDTPVQKYEIQVGAGIWNINTFLTLCPSQHAAASRETFVFKQPLW